MLPVCIYTDHVSLKHQLTGIIKNIIMFEGWDISLIYTGASSVDMGIICNSQQVSPVCLIDLSCPDAMSLVSRIRALETFCHIILLDFNTVSPLTPKQVLNLHLEVMAFITKTDFVDLPGILHCCLDKSYHNQRSLATKRIKSMTIMLDREIFIIPLDQILFLQSVKQFPGKIMICTKEKSYYIRDTLLHLKEQMDERFFCCYRGCIVNLDYIKVINMTNYSIQLKNEEQLPLSKESCSSLCHTLNGDRI